MKILNRFILSSYLRPFLRSFGVSLFILVLQFLSRYKEDLFGKGLDIDVILKIFGYASVSLVVLALPVSVLLASLFTMGTFGEQYELSAMRAGGMPVRRIVRPMFVATIFIAFFSFFLSSFVVPVSNLKLYSLLYDVKQLKPTFTLEPGHFNSSVDKYVIRIEDKNLSRDMLYDVMIYDHTEGRGNDRMVVADSGYMRVDPYGRYMSMMLYYGASYETVLENQGRKNESENFVRFYYDSLLYNFDLAGFNLERTSEEAFASHHYMLNIVELLGSVDSVEQRKDTLMGLFHTEIEKIGYADSSFLASAKESNAPPPTSIIEAFPKRKRSTILGRARDNAKRIQSLSVDATNKIADEERSKREYFIEFHAKFSLPMACLLFLFIGAPLGALVRKGGVGLPIVVSVVFYLTFYVVMIQGKKMAVEGVLPEWFGVWLPVLVMAPLAIAFTFQATSKSRVDVGTLVYLGSQRLQDFLVFILRPVVRLFQKKKPPLVLPPPEALRMPTPEELDRLRAEKAAREAAAAAREQSESESAPAEETPESPELPREEQSILHLPTPEALSAPPAPHEEATPAPETREEPGTPEPVEALASLIYPLPEAVEALDLKDFALQPEPGEGESSERKSSVETFVLRDLSISLPSDSEKARNREMYVTGKDGVRRLVRRED